MRCAVLYMVYVRNAATVAAVSSAVAAAAAVDVVVVYLFFITLWLTVPIRVRGFINLSFVCSALSLSLV